MAVATLRKFVKRIFIFLNAVVALMFLVSCLVPYLNPQHWWFMGFLGLTVPYLAILLIMFIFFWIVIKPVWFLFPLIVLLIGYQQLTVLFAVNKSATFVEKKDSTHLRIVDWNIRSFEGLSGQPDKKRIDRLSIAHSILTQQADVVCLQEFNHSTAQDNIGLFAHRFPYHYFSKDFRRSNLNYVSGSIIFSRFPIVRQGRVPYHAPSGESLIFADIKTPKGLVRIFTTHLQSFRFKKMDYEGMEKIKHTDDGGLNASKNLVFKMRRAFTSRGRQAVIVRNKLDQSPYPSLICGDFNDVPNGFAYNHIKGHWQDAFLKKSLGIGRTFLALAPTLRIDYILADETFKVHQFDMVDEGLSDHLMLVSDLIIP